MKQGASYQCTVPYLNKISVESWSDGLVVTSATGTSLECMLVTKCSKNSIYNLCFMQNGVHPFLLKMNKRYVHSSKTHQSLFPTLF